jgi:hypothetical protein
MKVSSKRLYVAIFNEKAPFQYSDCASVAYFIRHPIYTWRIRLPSMACLVVQYFSTFLINDTIFGEKINWTQISVDFLYNFFPKHFIFWEENGETLS